MLQSGATEDDIASYLETELVEHFGVEQSRDSIVAVAWHIRAWFEFRWHGTRA
jgi:hypothetical protein